ncbi:MAG: cellulose synthase subunit BcsC, partial [Phycisphaerales bacterium]|nr:cellulose synthase subunit BcsC [Phycisphaerales bacterium]
AAFERAAAIDPQRAETQLGLGIALLAGKSPGDASVALSALDRARAAGLDSAELYHHLGVAYLSVGRLAEAAEACRRAIDKKADYASAHLHLALVLRGQGDAGGARKGLMRALEIDPKFLRALHALAMLEAEAGNLEEAAKLFNDAIAIKPDQAGFQGLGQVLAKMGKERQAKFTRMQAEKATKNAASEAAAAASARAAVPASSAIAELEQRLTPLPDAVKLHFALSAGAGLAPPGRIPLEAVTQLFDRYADHFDAHLRGPLRYHLPEVIADTIIALQPGRDMDVMDLGCGTGLCGPLLRPWAATLQGVDVSPEMLKKARERGVYDRLERGDLVDTLRQNPQALDLLVAADVLIYLGDLAPTFESAAAALRPRGLFAFSVESCEGDRYQLRPGNLRFMHSKAYVQHLAAIYGFNEESISPIAVRYEAGQPVAGYLVILRMP